MWEYEIAKIFAGARVMSIYGGTSEIMKELISRSIYWIIYVFQTQSYSQKL